MVKILEIKMTRAELVKRVCNCATAYREYFVRGWATLDNGKIGYVQKFVIIDDFDICEYADKDYVSATQTKRIARELCYFALATYEGRDYYDVQREYNEESTKRALGLHY